MTSSKNPLQQDCSKMPLTINSIENLASFPFHPLLSLNIWNARSTLCLSDFPANFGQILPTAGYPIPGIAAGASVLLAHNRPFGGKEESRWIFSDGIPTGNAGSIYPSRLALTHLLALPPLPYPRAVISRWAIYSAKIWVVVGPVMTAISHKRRCFDWRSLLYTDW